MHVHSLPSFQYFRNVLIGNFISWPGIDTVKFKKLLSPTLATLLGHLDQERTNLHPTTKEEDEETSPNYSKNKTYNCFNTVIYTPQTKITYTDQTGRFPY